MSSTLPVLVSLFHRLLGHRSDLKESPVLMRSRFSKCGCRAAVGSTFSLAAKTSGSAFVPVVGVRCVPTQSLNTLFCKPGKDFQSCCACTSITIFSSKRRRQNNLSLHSSYHKGNNGEPNHPPHKSGELNLSLCSRGWKLT
jgi:hypothetical protein